MIGLALEMSTREGSAALLQDDRVLAERTWRDEPGGKRPLFEKISELLGETDVGVDAIELFCVGRGPGSYTGLRIAITAAQALALPGEQPVFTLSSGEALALQVAEETGVSRVAVVGNARRGRVWMGWFKVRPDGLVVPGADWTLVEAARLESILPPDTVLVSPDWTELRDVLPRNRGPDGDRFPRASWVGKAGFRRRAAGDPSGPLTPIYLHPPVFVPPSFPSGEPASH